MAQKATSGMKNFFATCEQLFKKFHRRFAGQLLDFLRQPFRLLLQFGAFLVEQPGPFRSQFIQHAKDQL